MRGDSLRSSRLRPEAEVPAASICVSSGITCGRCGSVYIALADDARQDTVPPAAEWLLDNFHIIAAAASDVQHDLPPSFFRRLPRIETDEFAGLPRIYALALELIGSSGGRLDAQRLQRFIDAFNRSRR